jgi:putative membrane protein
VLGSAGGVRTTNRLTLTGTVVSLTLGLAPAAWAQDETWHWHWELHPLWSAVVAVMAAWILLILFGWALLHLAPLVLGIIAAVLGIRWLIRNPGGSRSDGAVAILRERYARGEITKEEFDAKLRDLKEKP